MKKILLIIFAFFACINLKGQTCDPGTPTFSLDFTGIEKDSTWISPSFSRVGFCCAATGNETCLEFVLTLDTNVIGLQLDVLSGAWPGGATPYTLDCGISANVGETLCYSPTSNGEIVRLTLCKPGNNTNEYGLTVIPKPRALGTLDLTADCSSGKLWTYGLDISSKTITSVSNTLHDSYLNCTSSCDTTFFTPDNSFADSLVTFMVTGNDLSGCLGSVTLTHDFYIHQPLDIQKNHNKHTICFGETGTTLDVGPIGGMSPHSYNWSPSGGVNSTETAFSPGDYIVTITDNLNCAHTDTFTVDQVLSPITVDAGNDIILCAANDTTIPYSVAGADTVYWQEYVVGKFYNNAIQSADGSNLSYKPSGMAQMTGSAQLILVAEQYNGCPAFTDTALVTVNSPSEVFAGEDFTDLTQNPFNLSGVALNADNTVWRSSGSGTFGDSTSLSTTYTPTVNDVLEGVVQLTLVGKKAGCNDVAEAVFVTLKDCDINPTFQITNDNVVEFSLNPVNINAVGKTRWYFDDGLLGYLPNPTHVYDLAGTHNVSAVFETDDKICFDSVKVDVNIAQVTTTPTSIECTVMANSTKLDSGYVVLFKEKNSTYILKDIQQLTNGVATFEQLEDANYHMMAAPSLISSKQSKYRPTYQGGEKNWQQANALSLSGLTLKDTIELLSYAPQAPTWNTGNDKITARTTLIDNISGAARSLNNGQIAAEEVIVYLYDSNGELLSYTTTDQYGNFTFDNLETGVYTIEVEYVGTGVVIPTEYVVDGDPQTPHGEDIELNKTIISGLKNVDDFEKFEYLYVYPNPFNETLTFSASNLNSYSVVIYNALGKQVAIASTKNKIMHIETTGLGQGVYFYNVVSNNKKVGSGKLLK